MDFIKQMKKREFIEMSLKCLAAVMAAFVAIILMEGMIYSIYLNAYKTKAGSSGSNSETSIAYCIKEDDNKYFVLFQNTDLSGGATEWSATSTLYSKEDCTPEKLSVKEVVFHAPSAFEFTINGIHYAVIAVFVAIVAGYFVWRFIALSKSYKKIEEEFVKSGTIEISNM